MPSAGYVSLLVGQTRPGQMAAEPETHQRIKADRFLVMAHGSAMDMARAKDILGSDHPTSIEHHAAVHAEHREALAAH